VLPRLSIGYIGCFSDHHTEADIVKYLKRDGHQVDRYHFTHLDQDKFVSRADQYDIVITSLPQTLPVEFWRRVSEKTKLVAWYFDWLVWQGRWKQYSSRLKYFDLIISTDGFENSIYKEYNRVWIPHAADTEVYKHIRLSQRNDVVFIGHIYTEERRVLLGGVMERFRFKQYGQQNDCWGEKYSHVCGQAKIVIGDNFLNDIPGYWSDRVYMSLASGAFYLSPRVPGLERYFEDGEHLVYYDSPDDLYGKIEYYLEQPLERERIAFSGADEVARNHSWAVRVREFECALESLDIQTSRAVSGSSITNSGKTSLPILSSQSMPG
jgi:glycosyltransferase involved in cell wall biosynthesis